MLPNIDLDNERFDEILENARNMIVGIFPEWTDFNYHDPGMTMLETFAWLKESQQYFLNKIGPRNVMKYLKLIGVFRHTKVPSYADVSVLCDEDLIVPEGTKFYAGELCFEAERKTYIPAARVNCCVVDRGSERRVVEKQELQFGGQLEIKPFDIADPENGAFYIGFDKPLFAGECCTLYITLADDGGVPRNPITEPKSFIPLVDMKAEYMCGGMWREAELVSDETFAFITSGKLTFRVSKEIQETEIAGKRAFFLRFKVTGGEYDTQPVISDIDFNFAALRQRDTKSVCRDLPPSESLIIANELAAMGNSSIFVRGADGLYAAVDEYERVADEDGSIIYSGIDITEAESVRIVNSDPEFFPKSIIGIGTGLSDQEYDLECEDIEYESLEIMTQMPDISDIGEKYAAWIKVSDFSASGPADLHYVFDSQKGIVRFGNCINGAAPEGAIMIVGYALTAGAGGNITPNKINRLGSADGIFEITNKRAAYGGADEESIEDCRGRVRKILDSTDTIVTSEDCEKKIAAVQGLRIEKCRVIKQVKGSPDIVIPVVVKPYSPNGRGVVQKRYKENILRQIERFRMLGTIINIVSPQYTDIGVYADISTSSKSSDPREMIEAAVRKYFSKRKDSFGAVISYGELYRVLDSLDCVVCVNTLTIESLAGGVKRTSEGDLILSANAAAVLSETEFVLHTVY